MVYLKKIWLAIVFAIMTVWEILIWPYTRIKEEIRFRKRLKELRKKDPFIYK
mgnify:CR=1 FL=1